MKTKEKPISIDRDDYDDRFEENIEVDMGEYLTTGLFGQNLSLE